MWGRVDILGSDVSEEGVVSISMVLRISVLRSSAVGYQWNTELRARILCTLKMETIPSYETPVSTKPTQRHVPEDGVLLVNTIHITTYR
jgi:hypothetical protein